MFGQPRIQTLATDQDVASLAFFGVYDHVETNRTCKVVVEGRDCLTSLYFDDGSWHFEVCEQRVHLASIGLELVRI